MARPVRTGEAPARAHLSAAAARAARAERPLWLQYAVLWLAGIDLRLTILAVPPLLPLLHRALGLSEAGVGALSAMPVLVLGLAAIPGSLAIARLGAKRAMIAGIVLVAVASGLRGAGANAAVLFVTTFAMGVGVATMQPSFPALVHECFPTRVPRTTAVWANGLLVGEALAASFTLSFVLPLAHGSWPGAFALWALPVALTAVLAAIVLPGASPRPGAAKRAWLPDFRDARIWRIGAFQCSASLVYFGANTFVPDYLHATGHAALVAPALIALNAAQLPASFAIGLLPWRTVARARVCVAIAALVALALVCFLVAGGWAGVAASAVFGFASAYVLVLSFAFPAMLARGEDVGRTSAGVFTISYLGAWLCTLLAGAIWDATHVVATAFLPVGLGVALIAAFGPPLTREARRQAGRAYNFPAS